MLFSSYPFLFCFLPVFLFLWHYVALRKSNYGLPLLLLGSSLVFYAFLGGPFVILLLCMAGINFAMGHLIADALHGTQDKFFFHGKFLSASNLLACAIILNLLPLVWFKYSWFIIQNVSLLFQAHCLFTPPALPVGISFYTFIQIAWLCGVYRGQFQPAGLLRHTLFTSCFPYVLSGPIVRYEQVGWQFDELAQLKAKNLAPGFALFSIGLAKKVILADGVGFYADVIFNAAEKGWPLNSLEAWGGSLAYTFQLYFDFSGYTDMALGIGLMIGLHFPENFDSPYKSTGIVDFWRRWHITLSSWLRDFLYIPLGGNRHGKWRQYINLFLTMLIGGAWHGAGWTYIIWGGMHGAMLAINHFFRAKIKGKNLEKFCAGLTMRIFFIMFTFLCLNLCWVVFRAFSLEGALNIYNAMFAGPFFTDGLSGNAAVLNASFGMDDIASVIKGAAPNNYLNGWQPYTYILVCAVICWFFPNSRQIIHGSSQQANLRWAPTKGWSVSLAFLAFIALILLSRQSTFLYFQF